MRVGFILPNNWGSDDVTGIAELAVEAEALGLASVWVNHHIVNAGYIADRLDERPYHDALTVLTWAAAKTSRISVGTSVLVLPYLHPMVLAKALATLDQLSGGRLIAGLGVGSLPEENVILGVDYDDRGAASNEFIEVMRALWSDGRANHDGERWPMQDVIAAPKPSQDPLPIWIGGSGGPAQRRAARYGQGWHPMCSLEGLAKRMPAVVDALASNGRTRESLVVAPRVDVSDIADAEAVLAWQAAGADELVIGASGHDLGDHAAALAHIGAVVAELS